MPTGPRIPLGHNASLRRHILSIDQGTTGTTAVIVDDRGRLLANVNREFPQIFPKPGWVEHDPEEIWRSTLRSVAAALKESKISGLDISAIGIANQRETTVLWDRHTGKPVYNAIVWQDRRTADFCGRLKRKNLEDFFHKHTGLFLDPYFSGTKIRWLLDHVPGLRKKAKKGEIAFGTVDSFLLWRLTGGAVYATDVTNASRTLMMNLRSLEWDSDLCRALGVPREILPEIRPNIGIFGRTKNVPGLPDGIPISGMAGDQQSALFGQACFNVGDVKCTFGTGSFLLMNVGDQPVMSRSGCVSTVALNWKGRTSYALEGSAFVCGAAVQWLRDGLKIIESSSEIEALARSVRDSEGVQFVPALTGLGAPYWNPMARGVICGLTRGSTKAHLARAALEGMALQNVEILNAMRKDIARPIQSLKVDGGASVNDLLMQIQADYLGARCVRPKIIETTAMGAAFMAGLGVGIWKTTTDIEKIWKKDREFKPTLSAKRRADRLKLWQAAVQRA
jgi:glycerol kinase